MRQRQEIQEMLRRVNARNRTRRAVSYKRYQHRDADIQPVRPERELVSKRTRTTIAQIPVPVLPRLKLYQ